MIGNEACVLMASFQCGLGCLVGFHRVVLWVHYYFQLILMISHICALNKTLAPEYEHDAKIVINQMPDQADLQAVVNEYGKELHWSDEWLL